MGGWIVGKLVVVVVLLCMIGRRKRGVVLVVYMLIECLKMEGNGIVVIFLLFF